MITSHSCDLFNIPFFQFAQLKKYSPELIPQIKSAYKTEWHNWKETILQVSHQLDPHFAAPHIEKWCNGWQVRAHFFAFFKYQTQQHSAAILSVILNRRRLSVSLDWHSYRANRSQTTLQQYNQWLDHLDKTQYANFDVWCGKESEYADFRQLNQFSEMELLLNSDKDFFCIGKNKERHELAQIDPVHFIYQTIRELEPLYQQCIK